VAEGRLKIIHLYGGKKKLCILQYADDSLFMVRGTKEDVDELVRIFSQTSGMEINWDKSYAYLFDKYMHKSEWLLRYN
jgi:hypothetical protein